MFLVILLYAIFSGMTFINSSLMQGGPYPLLVGMIRALGSGSIIFGLMWILRRKNIVQLHLTSQQWRYVITYGVLIHAVGMCGFSWAVLYGSPVTLCFIFATAPFITAMIQYWYDKESLSKQKIAGLIVGTLGLVPILWQESATTSHVLDSQYGWLICNGIAIGSMFVFCYGWVVFKKLLETTKTSILLLNGIAMLIGGLVSLIGIGLYYGLSVFDLPYSADFAYLMVLFMFASLITYSLYAYLLQDFSPTFISFAGFLEPAFGMIYGYFLMNYTIHGYHLISFMVLFLGLYLFYLDELKKRSVL